MYEYGLDLDNRDRRQFWAEYLHYMVSDRSGVKRNDTESNPFWHRWGLNPDTFGWTEWREAMGYEHGSRR
jgi:hypothetical protein